MGNEVSQADTANLPPIENNLRVEWQSVQCTVSPKAREGLVSGVIGGKIYAFGGGAADPQTGPIQFNDLWAFDTSTNTWSPLTQFVSGSLPKSRTGAASVVVNENLYVFGGLNDVDGWTNDLHIFNPATNTWTNNVTTTGTAPTPRDKHSAVAIGSNIYVFGGFGPQQPNEQDNEEEEDDEEEDEPATFGWFNDLFVLDTQSLTWTQVAVQGEKPTPRAAFGMVSVGTMIVVFGGRDNSQRQNDLYSFDTTTGTWKKLAPLGSRPAQRSFQTLSVVGNKLVVIGGLSQSNAHLNDVQIYDSEKNIWVQPKTVEGTLSPRGFHSSNVVGNRLFVFAGGADYDSSIQENKTYRNDIVSMDLTPIVDAKFQVEEPKTEVVNS